MASVGEIYELAMQLTPPERVQLFDRLFPGCLPETSIDPAASEEWESAWTEEIMRRSDALHAGTAKSRDWNECIAELLEKYKPRGQS